MERNQVLADVERPDPEVQAGRALRRLRVSQGWSQEEVARRMQVYGYDFHQTMIAKIEAAQRPLRVRELADFAALYGVEIHELVYPQKGSLEDINQEIAEVRTQYEMAQEEARAVAAARHQAREALLRTEDLYQSRSREAAMLNDRLSFLLNEREKFVRWEAAQEQAHGDAREVALKPSPLAARTVAEFIAALRGYRAWAGNPSFRRIAARSESGISVSSISAVLRSDALPRLNAVAAIITGCGGDADDLREFATAWRRLSPVDVKRLSAERVTPAAGVEG